MVKYMEGQRPVHPHGTEQLGFVAPVWNMTVDCWRHNPAFRPLMAAVVEFLREWSVISLHTINPPTGSLQLHPPHRGSIPGYTISVEASRVCRRHLDRWDHLPNFNR